MKLSDFYFEDAAKVGGTVDIPLKDGTASGETVTLIGPECDESTKASRAFLLAYKATVAEYKPLRDKCEKDGDFTEYNFVLNDAMHELNHQMAMSVTCGWSFDDVFTAEALDALLRQHKALVTVICDNFRKSKEVLQEK